MNGLPTNVDAERFVLGSILLDDEFYGQAVALLQPDDFSLEKHRRIFKRMGELQARAEHVDRVTVANELKKYNELEACDGLSYLVSLDDGLPRIANLDSYIRIVKEKSTLRRIVFACQHIQNRCLTDDGTVDEILDSLAQTATDLSRSTFGSNRPISTREMIQTEGIDKLLGPRREGMVPISVWPEIHNALKGFHSGQIIVLMAATSRGKTSMALQAATCAAAHRQTPIIWTMEMSPYSLFNRMVGQLSGVRNTYRELDASQRSAQRDALVTLDDNPVYFDRHSRTVASFISSVRQVRSQYGAGFAVVDYLQLIRAGSRGGSRAQEVSDNSRALKLAAMDLGIPILVLSQVDRSSVKGDGKIGLHSGKETGDIENDADVVLWIEAGELSRDQDTVVSLHVGKQREGPAGFSIPMVFRPGSQTFMEMQRDAH